MESGATLDGGVGVDESEDPEDGLEIVGDDLGRRLVSVAIPSVMDLEIEMSSSSVGNCVASLAKLLKLARFSWRFSLKTTSLSRSIWRLLMME